MYNVLLCQVLNLTNGPRPHGQDFERGCYESLLCVLDTLESCLSNQPKDITRFDEAMNVKLLLREICQFLGKYSSLKKIKQKRNSCLHFLK